MKKIDFQDAMHDFEPCRHLETILKLVCRRHEIQRQDFMAILEVHAKGEFTWGDFATASVMASWDKRRFYRWKENGLVELYRAKDGKFRRYNLYRCTRKTKMIVREFYDLLSGKTPIPSISYEGNHRYSSKILVAKIKTIKKENDNGTTQEET